MKVIFQVQTEEGDTLKGIGDLLNHQFGPGYDRTKLWDFNRHIMSSPDAMPPVGSILRIPIDPSKTSGGPSLEELMGDSGLTRDDVARSTEEIGGVATPVTPGGGAPSDGAATGEGAGQEGSGAGGPPSGSEGTGGDQTGGGGDDGFQV